MPGPRYREAGAGVLAASEARKGSPQGAEPGPVDRGELRAFIPAEMRHTRASEQRPDLWRTLGKGPAGWLC